MLNQIKTPQSLFLAKERDKLWIQKAATCIESSKIHKIAFGIPLQVSDKTTSWGSHRSINKFNSANYKIVWLF